MSLPTEKPRNSKFIFDEFEFWERDTCHTENIRLINIQSSRHCNDLWSDLDVLIKEYTSRNALDTQPPPACEYKADTFEVCLCVGIVIYVNINVYSVRAGMQAISFNMFFQSINQSFTVWTTAKPELKSSASRRCSLIQLTCDAEHESDRSEGTSFAAFIFLKHSLSCLYNYYVIRIPENKKVMCGNIPWVCFASWHSFFSVW